MGKPVSTIAFWTGHAPASKGRNKSLCSTISTEAFVYVGMVVRALERLISAHPRHNLYHLGGPVRLSRLDLGELFAQILRVRSLPDCGRSPSRVSARRLGARTALWTPVVSLLSSACSTVQCGKISNG